MRALNCVCVVCVCACCCCDRTPPYPDPSPRLSCVPVYLCTMTTHVKRDILDNHFVCVG